MASGRPLAVTATEDPERGLSDRERYRDGTELTRAVSHTLLEKQLKQQSEQLKQQKVTNETLSQQNVKLSETVKQQNLKLEQQDQKFKQQNEMMNILMKRIERLEAPHETKGQNLLFDTQPGKGYP